MELHQQGVWASRSRVANDAEHHIQSVVRKKHRIQITDSGHGYTMVENSLDRDINATG